MTDRKKQPWEQELDNELGFLRENGVLNAYLLLLALAKNQEDIERLHLLLPENCRVMGSDLGKLRKLRRKLHKEKPSRPSDEICKSMFAILLEGKPNLTKHYHALLLDRREECHVKILSGIQGIVFSHVERVGHGGKHFTTTLFDTHVDMGIDITEDDQTLRIRMVVQGRELTQSFTHRVLNTAVLANSTHTCTRFYGASYMSFCFTFNTEPFRPHMEGQTKFEHNPARYNEGVWVIQDGFIELLREKLNDKGLDLAEIVPILPAIDVEDDDE